MSYAILFPGQGSQFVGMGKGLFEKRPDLLGSSADEILGWSLSHLCANGPEEELTRTDRAQPALFALSYALWKMFENLVDSPPEGAAGHSLGEYTALAAAGVFDYEEGLKIVAERGRAMDKAARAIDSGMAALIGADEDLAERIAEDRRADGGRLWVANVNAPGQVVLAGAASDIEWLNEHARDLGARRAIVLKVAGGFHSPLMEPAHRYLSSALSSVVLSEPNFPVWANFSASPDGDVATGLIRQLSNTVRFSESLLAMRRSGITTFLHIGPGDVTAGMVRRTVADAKVFQISCIEDLDSVVGALAVR